MKRLLIASALLAVSSLAMATYDPPPQQDIAVPVEQNQGQLQGQGQIQGQQTGVVATPSANANGTGTATVDLGSYAPNATNIDQRMRSLSIGFGAPVWTQVPQTADLCGKTKSTARKAVWGVVEWADSVQFTEAECAMLKAADGAEAQCRHLTAAMIRQRVFTRMWSDVDWGFLSDGAMNLNPVACANLIRPRLMVDARLLNPPAPAPTLHTGDTNVTCITANPTRPVVAGTKRRPTAPKPVDDCKRK